MALEVIGAGLPRTGTVSLQMALNQLGFGPCHHMRTINDDPRVIPLWVEALNGRPDWDAIFGDYRSITDAPGCFFYRELAGHFPNAKVILAMRDAHAWVKSVRATIFAPSRADDVMTTPVGSIIMKMPIYTMKRYGLSKPLPLLSEEELLRWFDQHNTEVKTVVPEARLLVYELGSGWEPVCDFLGVAVPKAPFPRENAGVDFDAALNTEAQRFNQGSST